MSGCEPSRNDVQRGSSVACRPGFRRCFFTRKTSAGDNFKGNDIALILVSLFVVVSSII